MLKEHKRLQKEIQNISKQLSFFPEGKLYCTYTGKYVKWHVSVGKTQTYIPKKNRKLAEQLAHKKYLTLLKEDLEHEKRAVEFYLRHHRKTVGRAEKLYTEEAAYQELLSAALRPLSQELKEWSQEAFETNTKYETNRKHRTASGRFVRSKSEAMIEMFLSVNQIPFRYENKLQLGDVCIYPDFTIRHPETGAFYYWEHFGMMDEPSYIKNVAAKLQLYSLHGIIPGIHLITTYETKEDPLNTEMVEKIVEYYFK